MTVYLLDRGLSMKQQRKIPDVHWEALKYLASEGIIGFDRDMRLEYFTATSFGGRDKVKLDNYSPLHEQLRRSLSGIEHVELTDEDIDQMPSLIDKFKALK